MSNRVRDRECLKLTIFTLKTWKIYDVCHIFIACRIRYETRITTWCCRFYSVNQETNVRCLSHFCCVPKLQNRAARALTFSSYDADASQLFHNLNWKNLSTQRDILKALMVFKSLNGLAPEYLSSKFIARSKNTSYTVRDQSVKKLTIPQPRTNYL